MSANKLLQVEFVMQLEGNALSINKVILALTLLFPFSSKHSPEHAVEYMLMVNAKFMCHSHRRHNMP